MPDGPRLRQQPTADHGSWRCYLAADLGRKAAQAGQLFRRKQPRGHGPSQSRGRGGPTPAGKATPLAAENCVFAALTVPCGRHARRPRRGLADPTCPHLPRRLLIGTHGDTGGASPPSWEKADGMSAPGHERHRVQSVVFSASATGTPTPSAGLPTFHHHWGMVPSYAACRCQVRAHLRAKVLGDRRELFQRRLDIFHNACR